MRKTPHRAPPSVATQVRKGTSKGGSSKGREHTATHSTYPWSQPSNSWNTTGQTNSWNRLLTDDHKTYRDVNEMPMDDLTNVIQLVSEPYWLWRREVVIDERKPKVPFNLTVIPDRRKGVLNLTSESVISSSTSCRCEFVALRLQSD